ncbi:MAG: hypothetical protein PHO12_02605 [Bacteroidales bacterium]|nr:hypothetical protein [Bacteroidales bacterium]MDD4685464.1 hypothetical protein [Bacteroidales bacterium]
MKRAYLIIGFLVLNIIVFAQPIIPSISNNKIHIGDQFTYSFRLPIDKFADQVIYYPNQIEDSLEIISLSVDTVEENGKKYIDFSYRLTSFVVGEHQILNTNGRSFGFEVIPFPIDTTKVEIKDIKENKKEPFSISEIMPIIIWVLIGIGLILGLYFGIKLWKKYRTVNIKEILIKPKPKLPAHIIAINSLEELRRKRLYENGRIKEYFSEISDILRVYLDDRFSVSAIEMTTDDIFREIDEKAIINKDSFALLEYILKYADLVKFAKHIPDSFISDKCMKDSFEFISQTKLVEIMEHSERKEDENV